MTTRRTLSRSERAEALDVAPCAVILVDRRGRLLHSNGPARRLIDRSAFLFVDGRGELRAQARDEDAKLRKLLSRAFRAAGRDGEAAWPASLTLNASVGARPLVVTVSASPFRVCEPGTQPSAALVVIADPHSDVRPSRSELAKLYGLTRREAELACLLADGRTLKQIAEEMGIGRESARTHLQRVMQKTGTNRQSELVRLLLIGCPAEREGQEVQRGTARRR